jgi:hypothetical protein
MQFLVTSASGANGDGYGALLAFGAAASSWGHSAAIGGSLTRAACVLTPRARWST